MKPIDFRSFKATGPAGLGELTRSGPLNAKIKRIHALIKKRFVFVDRIAIALYDSYSSNLKSFVSSGQKKDPLLRYEFPLVQALSLLESIVKGPRVVNDLSVFDHGKNEHTKRLREAGFQSSYTVPLVIADEFRGFIFLNSCEKDCFTEEVVAELDVYCSLITITVAQDFTKIVMLNGALKTAAELLRSWSSEIGGRMGRMSQISRWIGEELVAAGKYSFDAEWLEQLQHFSALHDIGKIAVPVSILMKQDRLSRHEFIVVMTHAEKGLEIVNTILSNFGLESMQGVQILKNIVLSHHEKMNGSGYPFRLHGNKIPIEARIVAVADTYDALTSERSYRPAFSSQDAFDMIEKQSKKLDPDCVAALSRCKELRELK